MKSNVQKTDSKSSKKPLGITIGSIIILVLSAVVFIFIPTMVKGAGAKDLPPMGYYKNKPIDYKQGSVFTTMLNNHLQNEKELSDSTFFNCIQSAFSDTVVRMTIEDEVKKSGYVVPDSAIDRIMIRYFSDENGNYSPKLYNETSDSTKVSMRKELHDELIIAQYQNDLFGDTANYYIYGNQNTLFGTKSPEAEAEFIYSMNSPEKAFDVVSFSMSDFPQEEIIAYGKKNQDMFKSYDLSVITVASESEANKVLKRINNNEITFDDAVTEYSNNNYGSSGGFSNNYAYQMKALFGSDEAFNTVAGLAVGEISNPVKTSTTYSIFRCNGAAKEADFTDAQVLGKISYYISTNERFVIEDYFMAKAREFASAAAIDGFDSACTKYGLTKSTTEPFAINYGLNPLLSNPPENIPALAGIHNSENFLKTAFALKDNEISAPIVLNDNVIVVKQISSKQEENDMIDLFKMYYGSYANSFDQYSMRTMFIQSDDVKDNTLTVFLQNMMVNNN